MPLFSTPIKLANIPFSVVTPAVVPSVSQDSPPSLGSPPNVQSLPPSPEKLMKMNSLDNTDIITGTALEKIQRKQTKILNFPSNDVELRENPDDDISTLSDGSMCAISRRSKMGKSRNLRRKKSRQMTKTSSMNTADEVSERYAENKPSQI